MNQHQAPAKFKLFFLLALIGLALATSSSQARPGIQDDKMPPLKISGVLESIQSFEIKPGTEQVKTLTISRLIPHGSVVKKGQKIFWFQSEALDKQIEEARLDLGLAEKNHQEAEARHQQFLALQKLDQGAAERNWKQAQQENEYYQRVDREFRRRSAEVSLKFSRAAMENAEEELNQLEKMYRSDDLTEESEEIVLKRSRQAVEDARFRFESAQNQFNRTINETLPRGDEEQEDRFKRAEITYQTTISDIQRNLEKREIEMQKQNLKFAEQQEKLQQLLADREKMVLKASRDGILVYGNLAKGALTDKVATIDVGKTVAADQVIATIIPQGPMQVRLTVSEAEWHRIAPEMEVEVIANTHPGHSMKGEVFSISAIPFAPNKFDCIVKFRAGKLGDKLIPTTGCHVVFSPDADSPTGPPAQPTAATSIPVNNGEAIVDPATADEEAMEIAQPPAAQAAADSDANSNTMQSVKETAIPPKTDPISGLWDGTVMVAGQKVAEFEMNLTLNADDTVSGNLATEGQSIEITEGKFDRNSNQLKFSIQSPVGNLNPEFKLQDMEMIAQVETEGVILTIRAVRR
jgi:HlyD family secretion protein